VTRFNYFVTEEVGFKEILGKSFEHRLACVLDHSLALLIIHSEPAQVDEGEGNHYLVNGVSHSLLQPAHSRLARVAAVLGDQTIV